MEEKRQVNAREAAKWDGGRAEEGVRDRPLLSDWLILYRGGGGRRPKKVCVSTIDLQVWAPLIFNFFAQEKLSDVGGVPHVSKNCLEYSMNFCSQSKKKKMWVGGWVGGWMGQPKSRGGQPPPPPVSLSNGLVRQYLQTSNTIAHQHVVATTTRLSYR